MGMIGVYPLLDSMVRIFLLELADTVAGISYRKQKVDLLDEFVLSEKGKKKKFINNNFPKQTSIFQNK